MGEDVVHMGVVPFRDGGARGCAIVSRREEWRLARAGRLGRMRAPPGDFASLLCPWGSACGVLAIGAWHVRSTSALRRPSRLL